MDPHYLGILVMVGTNKSKFMPSVKEIKECYYSKFRGKGGESTTSLRLEYERQTCAVLMSVLILM